MKLAEIRDLDGPNLFLPMPAIKVELIIELGDSIDTIAERLAPGSGDLQSATQAFFIRNCRPSQQPAPQFVWRWMDDPTHLSLAFSWERRRFGMALGQLVVDTIEGVVDDNIQDNLAHLLESDAPDDYLPLSGTMIARRLPLRLPAPTARRRPRASRRT